MTIKSSGILSLTDIQTEMGGANPIDLNEYYGGGVYTPSGIGIPTSGLIDVGSFYGKTKAAAASHSVTCGFYSSFYGYYNMWGILTGSVSPTTYKGYQIARIDWSPSIISLALTTATTVIAKSFLSSLTVNGLTFNGATSTNFYTNTYGYTTWNWTLATNPFPTQGAVVPVNLV